MKPSWKFSQTLLTPDIGLKLRPEIEQQLLATQSRRAAGQRAGTSAADVAARYGMTWQ